MADKKSKGEADGGEGDRVPVIAADQLRRLAEGGLGRGVRASRFFTFPPGDLSETMGCDPQGAAIFAMPYDAGQFRRFDRLVIDTTARIPAVGSAYLAVEWRSGEPVILFYDRFSSPGEDRILIVGRITGSIAARATS
jgi:hypothetical protein